MDPAPAAAKLRQTGPARAQRGEVRESRPPGVRVNGQGDRAAIHAPVRPRTRPSPDDPAANVLPLLSRGEITAVLPRHYRCGTPLATAIVPCPKRRADRSLEQSEEHSRAGYGVFAGVWLLYGRVESLGGSNLGPGSRRYPVLAAAQATSAPPESIRLNSSKSGIGEYLVPFQQGLDRASLLDGAGGSLRPCHPLLQLPLAVMIDDVPGTRRATILRFASTLAAGQNEVITGRHLLAKHPIDADWAPSNKMVYGWNSWWPHRSRGITPAAVSRSCRYTMLAGYLCCPVCGATRWQSGLRCLKRWKDPCRWAPAAAHSARKSLLRGTCTPRVFAGRGTGSHRVAGSHARRA